MKRYIFLSIACLCGIITAQAEPVLFGVNLQWEILNDTLFITSPAPEQEASMSFAEGTAPWANDSLSIKAIELPNNLKTSAVAAFQSCKLVQAVTIPASVTNILSWAFKKCAGLQKVICLPDTPPALGTDVFASCPDDMVICVPNVGKYKNNGWSSYEENLSLCKETPSDIETIEPSFSQEEIGRLIIESNQLLILLNNEKYTITGQKL